MKAAIIIHDTLIVLRANDAALELFRARPEQIIDSPVINLVADPELRGLAALRMRLARDNKRLPPQIDYIFLRFDGTRFFGHVTTRQLDEPGEWEALIDYVSEH